MSLLNTWIAQGQSWRAYWMTLNSTGNGTGVAQLILRSSESVTVTLDRNGKFYTDEAGTANESQTWIIEPGADRTMYVKVSSGESKCSVSKNVITKLAGWESGTNAPSLSGDITRQRNNTYLYIRGNNTLTGDVSRLTGLTYLNVLGTNTLYGNISSLTGLTSLVVYGNNVLSGSITNLTEITKIDVKGRNTLTGRISGLTKCQYFDVESIFATSNIEYDNVTNITGLCYLKVAFNSVLTLTQVNQIVADFWANKDEAKVLNDRTINILGDARTPAPTGNSLLYASLLADYKSPSRDAGKNAWSISVRSTSVLFMGTSITSGSVTSAPSKAFVALYGTACNIQTGNYGVSGRKLCYDPYAQIEGVINHLEWIPVKPNHARNLFLEFAANDQYVLDNTPSQFFDDYCDVIDYAVNTCGWALSEIKLLTVFAPTGNWQTWNTIISNVGSTKGVTVIDTATQLYNGGNYAGYMHDHIHPNDAGHQVIADYLFSQVVSFFDTRYPNADLAVTNLTISSQRIALTITGAGYDGISFEKSTDGLSWAEHGTNATSPYDATGLTEGQFLYWRARLYKTGSPTTYSKYSNVAHETVMTNTAPSVLNDGHTKIYSLSDDTANITKDGSNFVSAAGKTSNGGVQLVQSTGAQQPLWSETDGFVYDGTDLMNATFDLDAPMTIYMVASFNPANSAKYALDGKNADTGWLNVGPRGGTTVDVVWKTGGTLASYGSNNNLAINEFALISIVINGASSKMQVKENAVTASLTNPTGLGGITEGCRAAYNAYYASAQKRKALIIRNVADGDTDYNAIRNWLKTKYSV